MTLDSARARELGKRGGKARKRLTIPDVEQDLGPLETEQDTKWRWWERLGTAGLASSAPARRVDPALILRCYRGAILSPRGPTALQHLEQEDIGAAIRALAAELLRDGSPEALKQFQQLVEALTRPQTPPPNLASVLLDVQLT